MTSTTNCVCLFLSESLELARALDSVPPEDRGPLHGLPVSVKECFVIKGYDTTGGLSCFLDMPGRKVFGKFVLITSYQINPGQKIGYQLMTK